MCVTASWWMAKVGVAYGNPSNRFWPLLRSSGILPAGWRDGDELRTLNNRMPFELGIGITDIGCLPGSDAAEFGAQIMAIWRQDLYRRVRAHARRVAAASVACDAGGAIPTDVKVEDAEEARAAGGGQGEGFLFDGVPERSFPPIVAFTGKRHFAGGHFPSVVGGRRRKNQCV
jgi:hypothetical protein